MASLKLFRDVVAKILPKNIEDGAINFSTDTNELFIDYKDSNNNSVRRAVKDTTAARQIVYNNSVLSLQDSAGTTLSQASIVLSPSDFTSLEIGSDGHLYYEKSDQLTGVNFSISNNSDLILTIEDGEG